METIPTFGHNAGKGNVAQCTYITRAVSGVCQLRFAEKLSSFFSSFPLSLRLRLLRLAYFHIACHALPLSLPLALFMLEELHKVRAQKALAKGGREGRLGLSQKVHYALISMIVCTGNGSNVHMFSHHPCGSQSKFSYLIYSKNWLRAAL